IVARLRPAIFDDHIALHDEAGLAEALVERAHAAGPGGGRFRAEESDDRCGLLLCAQARGRNGSARPAEEESSPSHSITSSACDSTPARISSPNALAVCRLITNSNLVDCTTGRSEGLAPFRIRPV